MNVRNEVKKLIHKYKTNDPFELIDCLGINLIKFPLRGNLNGYYIKEYGEYNICIDSNLSDEEMTMVAAHELGHARLYKDQNILFILNNTYYSKDKLEKQANLFAAELLLDDNIFSNYYNYSLEYISKCECVSAKLVQYKFENFSRNI